MSASVEEYVAANAKEIAQMQAIQKAKAEVAARIDRELERAAVSAIRPAPKTKPVGNRKARRAAVARKRGK